MSTAASRPASHCGSQSIAVFIRHTGQRFSGASGGIGARQSGQIARFSLIMGFRGAWLRGPLWISQCPGTFGRMSPPAPEHVQSPIQDGISIAKELRLWSHFDVGGHPLSFQARAIQVQILPTGDENNDAVAEVDGLGISGCAGSSLPNCRAVADLLHHQYRMIHNCSPCRVPLAGPLGRRKTGRTGLA